MLTEFADGRYLAEAQSSLDSNTANSQQAPTFARLASGGLVATWFDNGTIVAQLYHSSGARIGAEFSIAASSQSSQAIGLAGGGFVIGWIGTDANGTGAKARMFDAAGTATSGVIDLNQSASGNQTALTLTALKTGGFAVAWQEYDAFNINSGIEARVFNASGVALTGDISVATPAGNAAPTIAALADGNFAVAYSGATSFAGSAPSNINARVYDLAGNPTGTTFTTNGITAHARASNPKLTVLSTGEIVLAWVGGQNSGPVEVLAQIFNAAGARVGASLSVSTLPSGTVAVAAIDAGFAVAFGKAISTDPFNSSAKQTDIAVQLFNTSGIRLGGDFIVNAPSQSDQTQPSIVQFGSSDLAIAFTDYGSDSSGDVSFRLLFNQILATSGDDTLNGSPGDDRIDGREGNDIISGNGGSDTLIGGDGIDTALYSGLFRSYQVERNGASGTVAGGAEGGTDTLTSIEVVQFKDGKFVFDTNGVAAQVTRLYDTVLQRGPDQVGLDYYVDFLEDHGGTLKQVATGFLNSAEFQAATGKLSNTDYVEFLYQNALGRSSDSAGMEYYVSRLESGAMDRADLLVGFSESPEHRGQTAALVDQGFFNTDDTYQAVALLYDTFAGRLPDAAGLVYYAELIKSGALTLDQAADNFANSPEFRGLTDGMSNSQLVNFMYLNTLDRPAEEAGLIYWVGRLEAGIDRGDLLLGFSQSNEHFVLLGDHVTNGIDYF